MGFAGCKVQKVIHMQHGLERETYEKTFCLEKGEA